MEGPLTAELDRAELERVLEQRIAQRTWGRIRHLRVEVTSERVLVFGHTLRYYNKQLALQVVLESLCSPMPQGVEIAIQVGPAVPHETRP